MWSPLHHFGVSLAEAESLIFFFPLLHVFFDFNLKRQGFLPVCRCPTVSLFLSKQLQIYEANEQCPAVKEYLSFT